MEEQVKWNAQGLVPAVVQDADSQVLLMLAYMNAEALSKTLSSGYVHFFSRSRQSLWKKGESSGNLLEVREVRLDCDRDAVFVSAKPAGPTCHTGATSCFFRKQNLSEVENVSFDGQASSVLATDDDGPKAKEELVLGRLDQVLQERRDCGEGEKSYTRSLLDKGFDKIAEKIVEESGELVEVLASGERKDVIYESADLVFHMMVGLCARGIEAEEVWRELGRRFGVGGHEEKASRS